ncbi:related to ZRT2-Zinc transporter II [Sporisorium reilianum f. sp. reilianum]|uniref:Related to ZRT2-Zinc transporter II n=1 Tax=Sporisorium reilianum f. sp. reilianum TaxID=72559 RepID=A0A2N8UF44_9BASI|nr:related to ZRT2-Zinc transporter II [Sporisorium reilianum f. sp. reilianum]
MVGFNIITRAAASATLLLALSASFAAAQSITTAVTVSGTPTTTVVAASPTGRGFCEFYIDHWDCDALRPEATASATATQSAASSVEPSPAGQDCHLHGDHWHCEGSEGGDSHAGHDHAGHNHAGHSHGPDAVYGCGLAPLENYDMALHVGALFVLLASSAFGSFLPIVMHTRARAGAKWRGWADEVFFVCRHFGTGVLISTAFVHLLSHAMLYWSNECIDELKYEATGPAIAMAAVWLVFLVDFFLLRALRKRTGSGAVCGHHDGAIEKRESNSTLDDASEETTLYGGLTFAQAKVAEWDVIAIEAGIIFHSILIGVMLGVATGAGFVALLITITFHQLFEGLALGSRLSLLLWKRTAYKVAMASAFVLTTPLGVAIGIGVRKRFNGNGAGTLATLGTFHALSAGILLYTALVELLSGDFIHNGKMQASSLVRCIAAVAALTAGMMAMSVLALWA